MGTFWAALTAAPEYDAHPDDRRSVDVAGLHLPFRATVAIMVVTFALLLDYSQTLIPDDLVDTVRGADRSVAIDLVRFGLLGVIPFLVVVLGFRERPSRYGLTLGDWRWGSALVLGGCAVMTPIVLWFATLPDVRAFYAVPEALTPVGVAVTNALELTASEFAFRGFLMLTLVRVMGPIGVLVATMPFVFAHLGKPELELLSTFGGGLVYGWLAWRTRSIVWGSIGHTYILTLVMLTATR